MLRFYLIGASGQRVPQSELHAQGRGQIMFSIQIWSYLYLVGLIISFTSRCPSTWLSVLLPVGRAVRLWLRPRKRTITQVSDSSVPTESLRVGRDYLFKWPQWALWLADGFHKSSCCSPPGWRAVCKKLKQLMFDGRTSCSLVALTDYFYWF